MTVDIGLRYVVVRGDVKQALRVCIQKTPMCKDILIAPLNTTVTDNPEQFLPGAIGQSGSVYLNKEKDALSSILCPRLKSPFPHDKTPYLSRKRADNHVF